MTCLEFLSDLVIERVYSVTTMYTPAGKHARNCGRRHWGLVMKYEGKTLYTAGGCSLPSDAAHIVLLPQGCSYAWQCVEAGHFMIVEFACNKSADAPIGFTVKSSERLLRALKDMEQRRNAHRPLIATESIRDLYSVLLSIAPAGNEAYAPTQKRDRIAAAVEYISLHYNESLTNDSLAALTGLSTVYFRKLFTATVGISPIAYVQNVRIRKAKEMLRSDFGTLSDIATSVGYLNVFHFSKMFKRITGLSPGAYAKGD